jgi:hypothetical protein
MSRAVPYHDPLSRLHTVHAGRANRRGTTDACMTHLDLRIFMLLVSVRILYDAKKLFLSFNRACLGCQNCCCRRVLHRPVWQGAGSPDYAPRGWGGIAPLNMISSESGKSNLHQIDWYSLLFLSPLLFHIVVKFSVFQHFLLKLLSIISVVLYYYIYFFPKFQLRFILFEVERLPENVMSSILSQ